MATIVESCPKCHQNASVEFGELHHAILRWYFAIECSHCGHHEKIDGLGRLPTEYRKILLQQEGVYQLFFEIAQERMGEVYHLTRDVFLPPPQEAAEFKKNLSEGYLLGTAKEVQYVRMRLQEAFQDIQLTIHRR